MNECVELLQTFAKINPNGNGRDYYNWVIRNGIEFQGSEPTPQEIKSHIRPKRKQCYRNSQLTAVCDETFKYYEGWVYANILPIEHAFLVKDGKVFDLTLNLFKDEAANTYFGVHIPTAFVRENMIKAKVYEPILWKYWGEHRDIQDK